MSSPKAAHAAPAPEISSVPPELNDQWVPDPEVTFIGKSATRSDQFLDWTLQNYNWLCVHKLDNQGHCDNSNNPLLQFWKQVAGVAYVLMFAFVLATAFVIVITRGQNITIMKFVPRFILLVVFVTLSFSIVSTLYAFGDIVQGFYLHVDSANGALISSKDLLYIDFDYQNFTGFRKLGPANDESAFITLLLVKLTAITYYVMSGILIVRKIILWFFLIVSPIFPLLILYRPIRNTAKIWTGEFFRWLLYAPLFALFLNGLVVMWRHYIPLPFDFTGALPSGGTTVYPTAVNILIGGPGQTIGMTNSANLPDTFIEYVVALLMLWVVILLPFLLLRIFLDYLNTLSLGGAAWMKSTINRNIPFISPRGPAPTPLPPPPPTKVFPTGLARPLPIGEKAARAISVATPTTTTSEINRDRSRVESVSAQVEATNEVLKNVNISIPKMRDIAKYETAVLSKDVSATRQVSQYKETLEKIANPNLVSQPVEREQFNQVRERLLQQKASGNPVASTVLSTITTSTNIANIQHGIAATPSMSVLRTVDTQQAMRDILRHLANPATTLPKQRVQITHLREQLVNAQSKGDPVATKVLVAAEKITSKDTTKEQEKEIIKTVESTLTEAQKSGSPVAHQVQQVAQQAAEIKATQSLPAVNKVQQVSIEEYEEVRKMWVDNYEKLDPPKGLNGEEFSREAWITNDIDTINEAVNLLNAPEEQKVSAGMEMVSNILPFLLLGGFSKSEVVTYLKAKLEAAKEVLDRTKKKQEEEDTLLDTQTTKAAKAQEMTVAEEESMGDPNAPKEMSPEQNPENDKPSTE